MQHNPNNLGSVMASSTAGATPYASAKSLVDTALEDARGLATRVNITVTALCGQQDVGGLQVNAEKPMPDGILPAMAELAVTVSNLVQRAHCALDRLQRELG